jgi:hypothetical protein
MYESLFEISARNPFYLNASLELDERAFINFNDNECTVASEQPQMAYIPIEAKRVSTTLHRFHLPNCLSELNGFIEEITRFSSFIKTNKDLKSDMDELDFAYDEKIECFAIKQCSDLLYNAIFSDLYPKNDENVKNELILKLNIR